jgi:phosphohistidine swiveling domain-containing protein
VIRCNKGETSGSGVAFSRDELTGAPEPSGDFLPNAQGEDVVSGVRTPRDLAEMRDWMPEVHAELLKILRALEVHYGEMQDTEFTIEEGKLYMLQTRNAKRPPQAAVRFAVDAVAEGMLTKAQALATIDPNRLEALLHPTFDGAAEVLATGVAASPGAAIGEIVFSADAAVEAAREGRDVILVRRFTEADDVAGFHTARGILTAEGGKASHAALVARGMGVPAVTGAAVVVDAAAETLRVNGHVFATGDRIGIDGSAGEVVSETARLVDAGVDPYLIPMAAEHDPGTGTAPTTAVPEMNMRISLRRLEVFCLVVEEGGVTRAAEHLFVAQPAVSSQIRALEEWVGTKLFARTGGRLVLTAAGQRVYAWAKETLAPRPDRPKATSSTARRSRRCPMRGSPAVRPTTACSSSSFAARASATATSSSSSVTPTRSSG